MFDTIFNPENRVWSFIAKVADMFLLQILWLICCLPIFTIGASSAALWKCLVALAQDREGKPFGSFFRAFKTSFKTATGVWAAHLGLILFLFGDLYICVTMTKNGQYGDIMMFFFGVLAVLGVLFLLTSFWFYPLSGVYTHFGFKKVMKNSVFLTMRHFAHTLTSVFLMIVAGVLCYYFSSVIILLPILTCYICAKVMAWIFKRYPNPSDEYYEEDLQAAQEAQEAQEEEER